MSEIDELVARLRAHESTGYAKPIGHPLDSYTTRMENGAIIGHEIYAEILPITKLRNPDGPAAADELARLQAELREARHERDGETRRIGKVMELGLGYQGGVGAFTTMADDAAQAQHLLRLHGFTDPYTTVWQTDALLWMVRTALMSVANYARQCTSPADMELAALKFLRWRTDRAIEAAEEACKQAQLAADREDNN